MKERSISEESIVTSDDRRRVAEVGDIDSFVISTGYNVVVIEAELILMTDEILVFNDITTENPLGEIDEEILDEMAEGFSEIVIPRERLLFGEVSDVNEDGYITLLFSYLVNEYGVVAFVSPCDLLDPSYCGYSNEEEIIYISIPDPSSHLSSSAGLIETIAHEFNHIIYFYRKFILNDIVGEEESGYIAEGMAGLAQDLTGYNNGILYEMWAALDASEYYGSENYSIQAVSLNDIIRFNPGHHYYESRDGALRGGAYLFYRYLFEQLGGMETLEDGSLIDEGGITFLREFFDSTLLGIENLESILGDTESYFEDWFTTLGISGRKKEDGTPLNTEQEFNYAEPGTDPLTGYQQGVDLWGNIHGWVDLTGPLTQTINDNDGFIRDGGVEYFIITREDGCSITISLEKKGNYGARYVRLK